MNTISLYAIVRDSDGRFFGGFDPEKQGPIIVDDVLNAKLFTNKFDINLRPDEKMVEVVVTLSAENTQVTAPFKPRRRTDRGEFKPEVKVQGGRRATD
jgi:hypothetical protein